MSNIEYLRQLHHKIEFEKGSIPRKGVLFLRKGPRFSVCVKDLIFIYYVHEKSLDFGRFIMLSYIIEDLKRLAFLRK